MSNPLVSIVMPAYNGARFIGQAIESVLGQSMSEYELVIVDDASRDSTVDVIGEYTSNPQVIFFRNDRNRGISYTTNRAISLSKGKYIALLDDDDEIYPDRLAVQTEYLQKHPDVDILGGKTQFIDEAGNPLFVDNPMFNPKLIRAMLLLRHVDFMNGTTMIRKEFIEKYDLKYLDDMCGMQDHRFFVEASKIGNISTIDSLLLKHRIHQSNETNIQKLSTKRRQRYADIQRYSISSSGFELNDDDYELLRTVVKEEAIECTSKQQFIDFYTLLSKMINEARNMKVDYLTEMEWYFISLLRKLIVL